jgi:pentatricopeptide repeat protein
MTNAFEYGDALLADPVDGEEKADDESPPPPPRQGSNTPYLNLATSVIIFTHRYCILINYYCRFRMVVLADEVLESFFETDLSASFRLESVPDMDLPPSSSGLLGDIWSNIATADNKKIFHKLTDEIGKTIGKHQVCTLINRCLTPTSPFTAFFSSGHPPPLHRQIHHAG